ncbi:oxidoreductase [Microvirga sp. KLBC 81]|nr:oxidoreductase [Microvirga sp. KLBC 81]
MLFAVLGRMSAASAAEPLPRPQGAVILTITGNITQMNAPGQARFDKAMLETLGKASYTTSSEVSATPMTFEGVPLRAVLERVGALGKTIKATALNAYQNSIPMEDLQFEPILAMKVDGKVITARDKGPLWIAYPRDAHSVLHDARYDSRWVWQLSKLHIE